MNKRIYGQKISINTEHVKDFYNKRAASQKDKIGAVLLGAQEAEVLQQKNTFDRDYIVPMLGIDRNTRVLDMGCGVGRWAKFVLPQCGFYYGIDFSEEMIEIGEQECSQVPHPRGGYAFQCMSILEAATRPPEFFGGKFGSVICAGVFMYINDETATQIYCSLPNLLEEHCTINFEEPVGIQKRLTLNEFASEELHTNYSAIYRTPEEYVELYAPLLEAGFSIIKQEYRPKFGETYTDTGRYFILLKR